jgi:hypothetical protein
LDIAASFFASLFACHLPFTNRRSPFTTILAQHFPNSPTKVGA